MLEAERLPMSGCRETGGDVYRAGISVSAEEEHA
nr:hypothetical protein RNT25_02797 [arsenite-oxidising bacterium NT-25]